MNQFIAVGNVVRRPDLRQTSNGKSVCSLTIAADNRGRTTFLQVSVWGANAENCCKYLEKGQSVTVTGYISERTHEVNGENRHTLELNADYVEFGRKSQRDVFDGQDYDFQE